MKLRVKLHQKNLWRRSRANQSDAQLREEFRQSRGKLIVTLKLARNKYYTNKLNESKFNLRMPWNTVNSLTGRQTKCSIDEIISNNFPRRQMDELANEFN